MSVCRTATRFLSPLRSLQLSTTAVLPSCVKIVEVGARDGLQIEKKIVSSADKIQFINLLSESGLSVIEVTSFVNPKVLPQMADAETVFTGIKKEEGINYPVLVMSQSGLQKALSCGAREIAVFTSASDAFAKKNVNMSATKALESAIKMIEEAVKQNIRVRGYISCVLGCPYSGHVDARVVADIAKKLISCGCYEVSLGDTIGVGTPGTMKSLLKTVLNDVPAHQVAVHCHDTYGQALANIVTAIEMGIRVIDSSVSGLGGCPFAAGATGNVATEDLLYMCHGLGLETGVDLKKVMQAGNFIDTVLDRTTTSRVAKAMSSKSC